MTATLLSPLADSRPLAHRWEAAPLALARPDQPPLDLRPPREPDVVLVATEVAEPVVGLPDPQAWSVALATTVLEVLAGHRPVSQLSRWLAEETLDGLVLGLPGWPRGTRPTGRGRLQSVRLQHPRAGVTEVSVHARFGARSVPLALRLEARRGRWLCTALELRPGAGPADHDAT